MLNQEKDMLLCYIADNWHNIHIDKELFVPAAGYIKDGKVQDFINNGKYSFVF